jgi:hypothetical protein
MIALGADMVVAKNLGWLMLTAAFVAGALVMRGGI